MVSNEALTNAIRSLDFTFKVQTDRMMVWKKRGSVTRVMIRRNTTHSEEYASTILRQAGMPAEEVEEFIRTCRVTEH